MTFLDFGVREALTAFGFFGVRLVSALRFMVLHKDFALDGAHSKISKSGKSFPHSKTQKSHDRERDQEIKDRPKKGCLRFC
jgi:hypothetical protein